MPTKCLIDVDVMTKGGFRKVFKAKSIQIDGRVGKGEYVVKQYLEDKVNEITNLVGDTLHAHTSTFLYFDFLWNVRNVSFFAVLKYLILQIIMCS